MRFRSTVILFALFLAGLAALWWADYAGVPDRERRAAMLNRVLPELIDTPAADVTRLEIDHDPGEESGKAVVLERRGKGAWQMTRPVDAAADAARADRLVSGLKDLPRSPDAGTIHGDPAAYGLDRPRATVRVFGPGSEGTPLATLDVGKTVGKRLYVRAGGAAGVDVVDPRALAAVSDPPSAWRDTGVFHLPSFRVAGVRVREANPDREIELRRDERHWRLTRPVSTRADDDKAEGLVAELAALHAAGDAAGFVKDDAGPADLARYGLDRPSMTLTLIPFEGQGAAETVRLGAPVPDAPDQVYAVRGDQDDVMRLDVKRLREALPGVNGLRSQTVLDFDPRRLDRLRVERGDSVVDLSRGPGGWVLLRPVKEKADGSTVRNVLAALAELKASEFLNPAAVPRAGLEPPAVRVRGWESPAGPGSSAVGPPADLPAEAPRFDLALGRHDPSRGTVFGRIAGDTTVLALPDRMVRDLPRDALAFRDKTLLALRPTDFERVSVVRGGGPRVTVEAAPATGRANQWRMTDPVQAPAEMEHVTALLMSLGGLRAESWESGSVGDGAVFGLDAPTMTVSWTARPGEGATGRLRIGREKPKSPFVYANLEGDPRVFTVSPALVTALGAELHDLTVMRFDAEAAESLVLSWPERSLTLNRYKGSDSPRKSWHPAVPFGPDRVEPASAAALVSALADLKTTRFVQYAGRIPEPAGLSRPRLTVRLKLAGKPNPVTVRLGNALGGETYTATASTGDTGPVFVLAVAPGWRDLLRPPARPGDLPDDVFTPASTGPGPRSAGPAAGAAPVGTARPPGVQ